MDINHRTICPVDRINVSCDRSSAFFIAKIIFMLAGLASNISAAVLLRSIALDKCDYQKQGLCDWPYKLGMTYEEIKQVRRENERP